MTCQVEAIGISMFNDAEPIKRTCDNLLMSQLFVRHGLRMPIAGFASSPLTTGDLIMMVGGTPSILMLLECAQG